MGLVLDSSILISAERRRFDMMIAASCITFGHRLATLNERGFERVDGLLLADARKYMTS